MSVMKRWVIPGLVAVGAVSGVSLLSETGKLEGDLTARSSKVLDVAQFDWASISFTGRDGTLSGVAPNEKAAQMALDLVKKEWGVRVVEDKTTLLPAQKPFTWSLERTGDALAMTGFVPYDLIKRTPGFIKEAAGVSSLDNQVKAARGEPKDFDEAVGLSATLLGVLPAGKAMLEDNKLTITGALEDGNAAHVELFGKLKELIASQDMGEIEVDLQIAEPKKPEPPKEPEPTNDMAAGGAGEAINGLIITRTDKGVDLEGAVPSDKAKKDLLSLAYRKFGFGGVEDKLAVKEGAEIAGLSADAFSKAANAALQAVSRLGEGKAELLEGGLNLKGGAFYDGALAQVKDFLASALPQGLSANSDLAVVAPGEAIAAAECQQILKGALAQNSIYFDSGKATISADSFGLLDGLIYTSLRCKEAAIQIEGHTDSDGDDASNQTLSEKRAQAVKGYLEAAGLSQDRLTAKGFGETKPVADNGTAEGKAKNRRIDFVIETN
ncbi:MAG: OmpA family protein [Cohaesibacter sp.]|nr:OmpA family protein [Cohaesibacter sp.]